MNPTPNSFGIFLINEFKEILLVLEKGYGKNLGKWGIPKGAMISSDNNDKNQCIKRKCIEEIGTNIDDIDGELLGICSNEKYYVKTILCKKNNIFLFSKPIKVEKIKWFKLEEL